MEGDGALRALLGGALRALLLLRLPEAEGDGGRRSPSGSTSTTTTTHTNITSTTTVDLDLKFFKKSKNCIIKYKNLTFTSGSNFSPSDH